MVIYFDITNIVEYAKRTSTVIGIPRVQLNIISLLARQHGGGQIRCTFLNVDKNAMVQFDPAELNLGFNFESDRLLRSLGVLEGSSRLPSKGQVKGYLRQFSHNKLLRTWKKIDVYVSALLRPKHLDSLGLRTSVNGSDSNQMVALLPAQTLPANSVLVFLGAIWLLPELWNYGREHHARGGKVVQMVYDLIPFIYPDYYTPREPPAFAAWLNDALEYTDKFICISRWTDIDLQKHAATQSRKVRSRPIPLAHEFGGYDRAEQVPMPDHLKSLASTEYVLCVGTIEHRKNNLALLKIWRELMSELAGRMPLLVFAGKLGRGGAEFQSLLDSDVTLKQHVSVIHSPSDADLAWLYQHCLFAVFPSQFEGWGLPVGEAAWFGKYTVASKVTSVPEVCGELIDYVDPFDPQSIKQGIKKPLLDRPYLERREASIRASSLRTWKDVADDIYAYINE